jgi:hypothetical protein
MQRRLRQRQLRRIDKKLEEGNLTGAYEQLPPMQAFQFGAPYVLIGLAPTITEQAFRGSGQACAG